MNYSPVAIFCYNRPEKLNNLVNSLKQSKESKETILYFFVDIPKDGRNITTENILNFIDLIDGFKEIKVIVRNENFGLAKNILNGIDFVFQNNDTIICLEDDLVVSDNFLNYMNNSLSIYKEEKKVWHINGWTYPQIRIFKSKVVIGRLMNSWGWATWSDRWSNHTNRSKNLISSNNKKIRRRFNFFGLSNWEQQLIDNDRGKINSWAIFWYQTIFLNNGFTVYPTRSHVFNDGMDGSGTNSGITKLFNVKLSKSESKNFQQIIKSEFINTFFTIFFYVRFKFYKKIRYVIEKIK